MLTKEFNHIEWFCCDNDLDLWCEWEGFEKGNDTHWYFALYYDYDEGAKRRVKPRISIYHNKKSINMGRINNYNGAISREEATEMLTDLMEYSDNCLVLEFNNPVDDAWDTCEIWYDKDNDDFEFTYSDLDGGEDVFSEVFANAVELIVEDTRNSEGATAEFRL